MSGRGEEYSRHSLYCTSILYDPCTVLVYCMNAVVLYYCTVWTLYCTTVLYEPCTVLLYCISPVLYYCTVWTLYCTTVLYEPCTVLLLYRMNPVQYYCTWWILSCTTLLYDPSTVLTSCIISLPYYCLLCTLYYSPYHSITQLSSRTHDLHRSTR